jgi:hypothetical protein
MNMVSIYENRKLTQAVTQDEFKVFMEIRRGKELYPRKRISW